MQLKINGKIQELGDYCSLELMVVDKGFDPKSIVIEHNAEIIPLEKWPEIVLKHNDIIEIVSFVGGG